MSDTLLYGKDNTENVVAVELSADAATMFIETEDGVTTERVPHERWILHRNPPQIGVTGQLEGQRTFKFFSKHHDSNAFYQALRSATWGDYFTYREDDMNFMVKSGVTLFKGTKLEDVSALAFDIETSGLARTEDSEVFLISNTFRRNGQITRRLFRVDEYASQREMIKDWCTWVRELDPTFLIGHNVFGFDLPYLEHCSVTGLKLGRNGSRMRIDKRATPMGGQGKLFDTHNCYVYGRQVIDTAVLARKADTQSKYPSYKLKEIIDYEGLTRDDRTMVDASRINFLWRDRSKREEIVRYCIHDADDALNLFDLISPSFFYYTRSTPMSFQRVITSNTGKQINAILCRSYIQDGRSIPEASSRIPYEGAISRGNPGLFKHVNKVDVASLYPSIIMDLGLFNQGKDPDGNMLKLVTSITAERLGNKLKAKETGDRYFSDLSNGQKIVANSIYGMHGTQGLNFNDFRIADKITAAGRSILLKGMEWVDKQEYELVNVDTDSFSYSTGKKLTQEVFDSHIAEINELFHDQIRWENDGQYKAVLVTKAKNYVLQPYKGDLEVKGSALKAPLKEPALRDFINDVINLMLDGKKDHLYDLYTTCALQIANITDITPWCFKKTVTEALTTSDRPNETRVLAALEGMHIQEGDKVFMFFKEKDVYEVREKFAGTYCREKLYNKLYKTMGIFANLVDIDLFPNYSLKRNATRLEVKSETDTCPVINIDTKLRKEPVGTVRSGKSAGNKSLPLNGKGIPRRINKKKGPGVPTTERD